MTTIYNLLVAISSTKGKLQREMWWLCGSLDLHVNYLPWITLGYRHPSPVDIVPDDAQLDDVLEKNPLRIYYVADKSRVINTGATLKVDVGGKWAGVGGNNQQRTQLSVLHPDRPKRFIRSGLIICSGSLVFGICCGKVNILALTRSVSATRPKNARNSYRITRWSIQWPEVPTGPHPFSLGGLQWVWLGAHCQWQALRLWGTVRYRTSPETSWTFLSRGSTFQHWF